MRLEPETIIHKASWKIMKFESFEDYMRFKEFMDSPYANPFEVSRFDGNVLLNEGIAELQNLITGAAATAWDNTNANLGVGDDVTAESATDTGLIAGVNLLYKGMEAGYPSIAGQITTWRAVFTGSEANFAWEEFSLSNTTGNGGDNLNRKTSSQGTKTNGQTWTLDLDITWS